MNSNVNKIICICGHQKIGHQQSYDPEFTYCTVGAIINRNGFYNEASVELLCKCMKFKQDNLKYVEQVYESLKEN